MKLIELIRQHEELFLSTVYRRSTTSASNKEKHLYVIGAIELGDWELLKELLTDKWYRKPLEGVIYCMKCDYTLVEEFLDAYELMIEKEIK